MAQLKTIGQRKRLDGKGESRLGQMKGLDKQLTTMVGGVEEEKC